MDAISNYLGTVIHIIVASISNVNYKKIAMSVEKRKKYIT